ncbi:MAG: YdbC family protein [Peptococcaceae bacterium]|nr:YdbC family protein [Peptococcaceae bacterium]
MGDLTYEIEKKLAVLSTNSKGWQKELNLVSWNNRPAKYDLREWSPDHDKMGKGVTLTEEEFQALKDALANM